MQNAKQRKSSIVAERIWNKVRSAPIRKIDNTNEKVLKAPKLQIEVTEKRAEVLDKNLSHTKHSILADNFRRKTGVSLYELEELFNAERAKHRQAE